MKKKLFIIPLLIVTVLSCISFTAYADDVETPGWDYPVYYSWENCCQDNPGYERSYIYLNTETMEYSGSWGCDQHKCGTYFFKIAPDVEYTEETGLITIPRRYIELRYYSMYYHYEPDGRLVSDQGASFLWGQSMTTDLVIKSDLSFASFNGSTFSDAQIVYGSYDFDGIVNKKTSVQVAFHPALAGDVNREVNDGDTSSMISKLKMYVKNNGSAPVQYSMAIYEKNNSTFRNGSSNPDVYFGDDPVFCYYSNNWVYGEQDEEMRSSHGALWTDVPVEYNKPSPWHYLASHTTDSVTFNFTQINLKQGVEYTVVVNSVTLPNYYDKATLIGIDSDISGYTVDFSTKETVYQSDFVMLQYDDIVYDPDDNSNGVLPYDGYSGNGQSNVYDGSYNAFGADGQYFYEGKTGSRGNNNGSSLFPSNSDTKYNTVLSQSSSVFSFFSVVLSYFPSDIWIVLNIALWTGLIVFVVRRLR